MVRMLRIPRNWQPANNHKLCKARHRAGLYISASLSGLGLFTSDDFRIL